MASEISIVRSPILDAPTSPQSQIARSSMRLCLRPPLRHPVRVGEVSKAEVGVTDAEAAGDERMRGLDRTPPRAEALAQMGRPVGERVRGEEAAA